MTDAERQEWERRTGLHPDIPDEGDPTESSRLTRVAAQNVDLCYCEADPQLGRFVFGWIAGAVLVIIGILYAMELSERVGETNRRIERIEQCR